MKSLLKYTHISRTSESFWLLVLNIEDTAHLVSIFGLETTRIKIYIINHLGIDETQAFLLGVTYKIRAEYFKIIYINQVLIITAATDIVLRGKFIVAANKNFDNAFHSGYWCRKIQCVFWIDLYKSRILPVPL